MTSSVRLKGFLVNALDLEGVHRPTARELVRDVDWSTIAYQYDWHLMKLRTFTDVESPGGLLTTSIRHNYRPPKGHPDNSWFREEFPYQYLGEVGKVFGGPRARSGGRKSRRSASKGEKTAAAIVPGGLHFGEKHGALKKEKRQHRDKLGLKTEEPNEK